jgi:hypothetical protein
MMTNDPIGRRLRVVFPLVVAMSATAVLWCDGKLRRDSEAPAPRVAIAASLRPHELIPPYHVTQPAGVAVVEVRCRVVSADDGRGIAAAQVELMQDNLCAAAPDPVCAAELTDEHGWVRFAVGPNRCRLRVTAEGYAPATGAVFAAESGRVEQRIALSRDPGAPAPGTARPR